MSALEAQSDSWGAPAAPAARRVPPPSSTVRDDWDDDEEEQEEQDMDAQRLWEEADARAPMPELVMAGSSTSNAAVPPPPAAFQPVLRILKRPTATPTSSSSSTPPPDPDASNSYAAREARYQAARERIFGDASSPTGVSDGQATNTKPSSQTGPASVRIAREPKGPPAAQDGPTSPDGRGQGEDSRGFGARRGKRTGVASGKPS